MNTTPKYKVLVITVAILLLTNIAMLFFFLNKGPERRNQHGGRETAMIDFLKKDMGFNDQQMQQYEELSKQRKEKLKTVGDEMRTNRTQLFKELGAAAFNDSAIAITAEKSAAMQKQMEAGMLMHLKAIRSLCTAEQQPKFDSLFYKIWNRKGEDKNKSR